MSTNMTRLLQLLDLFVNDVRDPIYILLILIYICSSVICQLCMGFLFLQSSQIIIIFMQHACTIVLCDFANSSCNGCSDNQFVKA